MVDCLTQGVSCHTFELIGAHRWPVDGLVGIEIGVFHGLDVGVMPFIPVQVDSSTQVDLLLQKTNFSILPVSFLTCPN